MSSKKSEFTSNLGNLFREAGLSAKAKAIAIHEPEVIDDGLIRPVKSNIFNVLEYIESSWGLNLKLWPVQRFIVKLYYHLPLNDQDKTIEVWDMFREKRLYHFTETEYLRHLYNEGRCNIGVQDHNRQELILALGRRSGKTTLSGIFASYEVYRLLNLHNPQGYYGLPPGNRIQIISVATDKEQASILFNELTAHLTKCEYFKPYIISNTLSDIKFRTPHDIEKYGPGQRTEGGKFQSINGKASIRATFKSCVAKGLRGHGNIVVIMDEMAHYKDKGQSSAKDIYDAVTPSTAAFSPKNPQDTSQYIGDVESRIISISSPLNRTGQFWDLFQAAMSGASEKLAIQAPTWEINPTVPASYYTQKYHSDAAVFMTEHGAQFSDRVRGWIEREEDLLRAVNPERRPVLAGLPRQPHQMGIDVGLKGDGTSFVLTFIENGKVVLAYHELWVAGSDWREINPHLVGYSCDYVKSMKDTGELDFDEIANHIQRLTRRFHITKGIFDRWNGLPLEQALVKKGLAQFESKFFTTDERSKMYQAAKLLMASDQLELYNYPTSNQEGGKLKHSPLIQELLTLQAEQRSKNVVLVAAPDGQGYHDDLSDALIRSIFLSYNYLVDIKAVFGMHGGQGPTFGSGHSSGLVGGYQMKRARAHGGFGMERVSPRNVSYRRR